MQPGALRGGNQSVARPYRGDVEAGGDRRPGSTEDAPGLERGENASLHGLDELLGAPEGRRCRAVEECGARGGDGPHDRYPAPGEIAEGLGAPLDVARPEVRAAAPFPPPPLVDGEPAWQRAVGEGHPRAQPGVARGGEHLAVALDHGQIRPAVLRFDPGPVDRQAQRAETERGEQRRVVGVVEPEAVPLETRRGVALVLPGEPVGIQRRALGAHRRHCHAPLEWFHRC